MEMKDKEVLKKILLHIQHAIKYSSKYKNLKDFEADDMCVEATVFNLMQIGELAKSSLSDSFKSEIKNIPWNQIYGLRNRIVHGYEGVDLKIVWDTLNDDLPVLKKEIDNLINENKNQ